MHRYTVYTAYQYVERSCHGKKLITVLTFQMLRFGTVHTQNVCIFVLIPREVPLFAHNLVNTAGKNPAIHRNDRTPFKSRGGVSFEIASTFFGLVLIPSRFTI